MKKRKWRFRMIVLFILLVLAGLLIIFIDNKNIVYEEFKLNEEGLVKVIHLSDLHFPDIIVDTNKLIENIKNEQPDFLAITGDLIDRKAKVDTSLVYEFIDEIVKIAPVYYVNGNHEADNKESYKLYQYSEKSGVHYLKNESVNLTIKGKNITIIGLLDDNDYNFSDYEDNFELKDNYRILLAHHPEKFKSYINGDYPPNLILSGHAHGGQFRVFSQGFIAPNQGLFPKYTNGLYESNNSSMIVSRGIGSSVLPIRFNNKPHVPIIII